MTRLSRLLILVFSLFAVTAAAQLQTFTKSSLAIQTGQGARSFNIELALTPAQQEQGLMFRQTMAADAGMLFVFPESHEQAFWMHNTYIPLDMIFIKPDGSILSIAERAVPLTDTAVPSRGDAKYVLELNGGTAARLGIKSGDKVTSPAIKP